MTDPMHPTPDTDEGFAMLIDFGKKGMSVAAQFVRVVGPYLACAAITLGVVTALDVKELRDRDKQESEDTFVARCEAGNDRLVAQLDGNREAIIEFGLVIIERAPVLGIDVNDPEVRSELVAAGDEVFDEAYNNPDLIPADCADITSTTTTTP